MTLSLDLWLPKPYLGTLAGLLLKRLNPSRCPSDVPGIGLKGSGAVEDLRLISDEEQERLL